jgi:very-short-patch-repair endonuclease
MTRDRRWCEVVPGAVVDRPRSGVEIGELDELARRNHGVVTRDGSGLSADAWKRALRRGTLIGVQPGVARLPGTEPTHLQAIAAAVLSAGDEALASHRSAAFLWGIPRPLVDPVDVLVPDRGTRLRLRAVRVHRPTDQADLARTVRKRVACTTIVRTLLDLGAVDRRSVRGALGHALTNRLVTVARVERAIIEHSRQGRSGIVPLRSALATWTIDGKPADSVLELAMVRLCRRYRLPPVEFHPIIEGFEVDFRVIGTPLVLECDGWAYHGADRAGFERDRVRDAALIAAGWIPIRFTYRAVTHTPFEVARRIRDALATWGSRPAPDGS